MSVVPVLPSRGPRRPLGLGEVTITGGFWGRRQDVNSANTIAHCHSWMERLGWLDNFRDVAAGTRHDHRGMVFADSEAYKLSEAMAWEVGRSGSHDAAARLLELTEIVASAQEADGYLDTVFGHTGRPPRYSDLEWGHELYNAGHLIQAGVAEGRVSGAGPLLDVARRAADHVVTTFGAGGIERVGGHPEIEMALVELARLTGEQRYLDQARRFVDRRGHQTLGDIELGRAYFQDDVPIREADVFRGHAVRALYLACGAVDVAVETGDDDLLRAIVRQWERTIARRTYLTGGMGSHHTGESFGDDFVLPPDRAYAETCAGIASVMLAWRLLLATGDARFADLIERTLFNVIAASPAPDGRAFFYANPLQQRVPGRVPDPGVESRRASSSLREPWFHVSCCPTNLARTFASLGCYLATADDHGVQLYQYATGTVTTTLPGAGRVGFAVATDYPHRGAVSVRITEASGRPWTLTLRVPSWAGGAELVGPMGRRPLEPGLAEIAWPFAAGDEVTLTLPLVARVTAADPRVDAVRGCVAVERGPVAYCAESVDLPDDRAAGHSLDAIAIDPDTVREVGDDDGVVVVDAAFVEPAARQWPYAERRAVRHSEPIDVPLHPYHDWATRGPAAMRVWLPTLPAPPVTSAPPGR